MAANKKQPTPQVLALPETERLAQAAQLGLMIGAQNFGLTVSDVAEYWGDYSRDYSSPWLELNPANLARFVGWLLEVLVRAAR